MRNQSSTLLGHGAGRKTVAAQRPPDLAGVRGMVFDAVPMDEMVKLHVSPDGKLSHIWPNRIPLTNDLLQELPNKFVKLLHPTKIPVPVDTIDWVVNTSADADHYARALIDLDTALGARQVRIFNHPRAVALTRRDLSAKTLAGIPHLTVPQCIRFTACDLQDFPDTFRAHGFRYPVLVRQAASQSGQTLVRIDGEGDWEKLGRSHWFGRVHYMTQFVDTATQAERYIKARVIFVGGRTFIRHVKLADYWRIHNDTAPSTAGDPDWEAGMVETLKQSDRFSAICADIQSRTGMDFLGLDIGINPEDERFVLFECNAAMSVFFPGDGTPRSQARARQFQEPIRAALRDLLRKPHLWGTKPIPATVEEILQPANPENLS